jgi:hypothetical protein
LAGEGHVSIQLTRLRDAWERDASRAGAK